MPRLVLASASPQRKSLLAGLGVDFEVIPSGLNEADHSEKDPVRRAAALARLKAEDIAAQRPDHVIIGCDTLVVSPDGALYEKPEHERDVERMLRSYSGKSCLVHSALCIVSSSGDLFEGVSSSAVTFKTLTESDIAWWISTKLWQDRSGGFQIDGLGQLLIEKIAGDWTSVVGLPVFLLGTLLEEAGVPLR